MTHEITILGEQIVDIERLVVSDDFADRLSAPRVQRLADSIDETTLIHPPMVRASDGVVVAGEDRVAAYCLRDRTTMPARLVECSDEAVAAMREAENAVRRHLPPAELAARVEEVAQVVRAPEEPGSRPGRRKTARGRAVEQVAKEERRSPVAVRKAAERERKRQDGSRLELWGRPQPEAWLEQVGHARLEMTESAYRVQAALATCTRLKESGAAPLELERVREALVAAGALLRANRPSCVCGYCKNLPGIVAECIACAGRGYLTEAQAENMPGTLKEPSKVMVAGKLRTAALPAPDAAELF